MWLYKKRFETQEFFIPENAYIRGNKLFISKNLSVKLARSIPSNGVVGNAVRLYYRTKWYASFTVTTPDIEIAKIEPTNLIGIDIGFRKYATLSDGTYIENPRWTKQYARKLAHWQRKLSRQQKGSNRRIIIKKRIAKIHAAIANHRKHFSHLQSKLIANKYEAVCLENHSLKTQTKLFGKSLHDVGHGHFRSCMTYKMADRGKILVLADQFFPSSKLCSKCGLKNEELKMQEKWTCSGCGTVHNRDFNAAKNLEAYGRRQVTTDQV